MPLVGSVTDAIFPVTVEQSSHRILGIHSINKTINTVGKSSSFHNCKVGMSDLDKLELLDKLYIGKCSCACTTFCIYDMVKGVDYDD